MFVVQLDCTFCLALLHAELLMMSIPLQIQHRSLFPDRCINVDFSGAVWILSFWGNCNLLNRLSYLTWNLIFHNFFQSSHVNLSQIYRVGDENCFYRSLCYVSTLQLITRSSTRSPPVQMQCISISRMAHNNI